MSATWRDLQEHTTSAHLASQLRAVSTSHEQRTASRRLQTGPGSLYFSDNLSLQQEKSTQLRDLLPPFAMYGGGGSFGGGGGRGGGRGFGGGRGGQWEGGRGGRPMTNVEKITHPSGLSRDLLGMFRPRPPLVHLPPPQKRKGKAPFTGTNRSALPFAAAAAAAQREPGLRFAQLEGLICCCRAAHGALGGAERSYGRVSSKLRGNMSPVVGRAAGKAASPLGMCCANPSRVANWMFVAAGAVCCVRLLLTLSPRVYCCSIAVCHACCPKASPRT